MQGPGTAPAALDSRTADYRFLYWGPAGSWTALHADVLRSYSWCGSSARCMPQGHTIAHPGPPDLLHTCCRSANLAGRKRWLLLPPEHTWRVYDLHMRECATHFGPLEPSQAARFPNLHTAWAHVLEVLQVWLQAQRGSYMPAMPCAQPWPLQEPHSCLFVPSGWHHTVQNLTDTCSINHSAWQGQCPRHDIL